MPTEEKATVAERVANLEKQHRGTLERIPLPDGSVRLAIVQPNGGDRISADGANTAAALAALEARLGGGK
ncbi:MAG: hypothetical protein ACSLFE_03765 [Gemmatimonadaceae bacterium]